MKEKRLNSEYNEEGNISVNSQDIEVEKEKQKEKEVQSFNNWIVPVGKRSFVTFADGSKLWVNSVRKLFIRINSQIIAGRSSLKVKFIWMWFMTINDRLS